MERNTLRLITLCALAVGFTPFGMVPTASAGTELEFVFTRLVDLNTNVPDGTGTFTYLNEPGVDQNGDVAFSAKDANDVRGIYAIIDGTLIEIVDQNDLIPGSSDPYGPFDDHVEIKNGTCLFNAWQTDVLAVSDGVTSRLIARESVTQVPGESAGILFDGINNSEGYGYDGDVVAFTGSYNPGSSSHDGTFQDINGTLSALAKTGETAPNGEAFLSTLDDAMPDPNGDGVIFRAGTATGDYGLYLYEDGVVSLIADNTTPIPDGTGNFTSVRTEARIDNGQVAFRASGVGGQTGVYLFNGATIEKIIDTSTVLPSGNIFTGIDYDVSFNNGMIAFLANDESELVVWRNGSLYSPIAVGDSLDDGIVSNLGSFRRHCLDGDYLGLNIRFDDGSRTVYLVEIVPVCGVPEHLNSIDTPGYTYNVDIEYYRAFVADGSSGLRIIDVWDPENPVEQGSYDTPGTARDVAVENYYAYVADGSGGLQVIYVGSFTNPSFRSSYPTSDSTYAVVVEDSTAYIADGATGVVILDVSDPYSPTLLGSYDTPGEAIDIDLVGGIAYVADRYNGLQILDVSDPTAPSLLGSHSHKAFSVTVADDIAYLAADSTGVVILDVSDPTAPVQLTIYDTPGEAGDIAIRGKTAYIADSIAGMQVIDVSNPALPEPLHSYETLGGAGALTLVDVTLYISEGTSGLEIVDATSVSPVELGSYDTPGFAAGVTVMGTTAYVADGNAGLQILDVSNPSAPTLLGLYDTPDSATAVAIVGKTAYVADEEGELQIIDVSDSTAPALISSYNIPNEAVDIVVRDSIAYIAGPIRLMTVDVSDPAAPALLGSFRIDDPAASGRGLALSGTTVFMAAGHGGLLTFDVSNPASPVLLSTYPVTDSVNDVAVVGDLVYMTNSDSSHYLDVIDVSDPSAPTLLGSCEVTRGDLLGLAVSGSRVYAGASSYGLHVFDVSDPTSPYLMDSLDTEGSGTDATVMGETVYVADGTVGMLILDYSNPCKEYCLADLNHDGLSNLVDFTIMANCLFGPANSSSEGCATADVDDDGDIDLRDFALFQAAFSQP